MCILFLKNSVLFHWCICYRGKENISLGVKGLFSLLWTTCMTFVNLLSFFKINELDNFQSHFNHKTIWVYKPVSFLFVCLCWRDTLLCVFMWKPEEMVRCLPLLLSAVVLGTVSLTEPGAHCFSYTGWPVISWDLPVFPPTSYLSVHGLQIPSMPTSFIGAGDPYSGSEYCVKHFAHQTISSA